MKYNQDTVLYFNAISISNKIDCLDILLKTNEFSIVFIVETWLKPFHPDSLIIGTNPYSIVRHDRLTGKGGGVCAIFKNSLAQRISVINIDLDKDASFEILAFDLFVTKSKSYRFVCIYLPPHAAKDSDCVKHLVKILTQLSTKHELLIFGDFNFSSINWKNSILSKLPKSFLYYTIQKARLVAGEQSRQLLQRHN